MLLVKKIKEKLDNVKSLEELAFILIVPGTVFASVLGMTMHPVENYGQFGVTACLILCVAMVFLTILYAYGIKKNKFNICYPVACGVVSIFCLPILFLLNGGFYSGMILFLLTATVVNCFCSDSKARLILFFLTQAAYMIAFYLAFNGKATQLNMSISYFNYDVMINYAISAVSLFVPLNAYLNKAKRFENGTNAFKNYVDEKVAEVLIDKKERGVEEINGVLKKVTVLFADIHNFTGIAEKMNPETVANFVNTFLEYCDEAVNENHGVLDKYIGDCAMAYWIDEEENESVVKSL